MLKCALKMYLEEIFNHFTYLMVFGILLIAQYFAITQYKGDMAFVELLQFIVIPVYLFLVLVAFFTGDKVLTFELVLFRDWLTVALARLISLIISLIPFVVTTALVAHLHNAGSLIEPMIASTLFYATLVLLSTLIGGSGKLYVLSMGVLFVLPFSSIALIQTQAELGTPAHGISAYLSYLFSPVYGTFSAHSGSLIINLDKANTLTFSLSLIWILIYLGTFGRRNVHPSG